MIMDACWNYTDGGREKCSEMNLVRCKVVQLKFDIAGGRIRVSEIIRRTMKKPRFCADQKAGCKRHWLWDFEIKISCFLKIIRIKQK
jgi:hypothetical protein